MKPKSKVLVIAGSDSSGGAGVQADIKTITSLGSYALCAITAITTQNTTGVKNIIPVNPKFISSQIEFSSKDIRPHVVKIGMLHNEKVISAVMKSLKVLKLNELNETKNGDTTLYQLIYTNEIPESIYFTNSI